MLGTVYLHVKDFSLAVIVWKNLKTQKKAYSYQYMET